jgi:hypothetical protein
MRSFGLSTWLVFVIFFVLGSGTENIFGQEGKEEENNLIAQYLDIARKSSKDLIETMRDALLKELEKGDVLSAVSVCSELSQNIIKEKQQKYGFYIRRISEKYRNEKNKPDKYELFFS